MNCLHLNPCVRVSFWDNPNHTGPQRSQDPAQRGEWFWQATPSFLSLFPDARATRPSARGNRLHPKVL